MGPDNWQATANDLRLIALYNPRLALMLVRGQPVNPRAYTMEVRFTQTSVDQAPVDSRFAEQFYQDCWLQQITYTLHRPSYLTGSPYKCQSDDYTARRPYVEMYIRLEGAEHNELIENFAPLENIAATHSDRAFACRGFVIPSRTNIKSQSRILRTLGETEVPYIIKMTFSVLELTGCNLRSVDESVAIEQLQRIGLRPCFTPPACR